MDRTLYNSYISILNEELVPAMGCTEPIAVAYAAAIAAENLGILPQKTEICVSANIIKNVKSVVVPNTGGLRGLAAAAAAGIVAGNASRELEVIASVSDEKRAEIAAYLEQAEFTVSESDSGLIFDILVSVSADGHSASCRIAGFHTNVIHVEYDGKVLKDLTYRESGESHKTDRSLLSIEQIINFADAVVIDDVRAVIARQIEYNMAIAEAGMEGNFGACIGKVLLDAYGDTVYTRAKAYAAAASDARMNGCSLPVIINSGSGNQGITASVPVVIYARHLGVDEDTLYRALVVSNLVTTHLKTGIGRLSAYCGAISAGCGAGAGISYLYGGRHHEIAHTVVNALAINSGVICDGAKSSCAAKIASAVEAGLLGMQMDKHGQQFYDGDGIVTKGVENTIRNVGRLARLGMAETDKEIIGIMIKKAPRCEPF
ncbi:MAG: serine dehydratase subunit alpha family protein [Oscillospiraceae bacterium]|nr:serine dehydratase subunit alpha family protein [Oscillospiraceae bacterium]